MAAGNAGTATIDFRGNFAALKSGLEAALSTRLLNAQGRRAGTAIAAGIGVAAFGLAKSIKLADQFQQQMTLVHTQAGASAKEVKNLSDQVLQLAKQRSEFSPNELAKGLYRVESAGFHTTQAMEVLKKASELAAVGQADLEGTTHALTGTLRTGIRGSKDLTKTVGSLNAIIGAGSLRMDDLNSAIGTGFFSNAKQMGLSLNQAGAALATVTRQGQPATQAATRLSMAFRKMVHPTDQGAASLAAIGVNSDKLAKLMEAHKFPEAIGLLVEHLNALGDNPAGKAKAAAVISDLFGARSASGITTIIQGLKQYHDTLGQVEGQQDKFPQLLRAQQETMHAQWLSLVNDVKAVEVQIGLKAIPVLQQFLAILTNPDLSVGEKFTRFFNKLGTMMAQAGVKAALLFVDAFIHADIWGKLAIGALLIRVFGGKGAITAVVMSLGRRIGTILGIGIGEGAASSGVVAGAEGGAAAGAAGGAAGTAAQRRAADRAAAAGGSRAAALETGVGGAAVGRLGLGGRLGVAARGLGRVAIPAALVIEGLDVANQVTQDAKVRKDRRSGELSVAVRAHLEGEQDFIGKVAKAIPGVGGLAGVITPQAPTGKEKATLQELQRFTDQVAASGQKLTTGVLHQTRVRISAYQQEAGASGKWADQFRKDTIQQIDRSKGVQDSMGRLGKIVRTNFLGMGKTAQFEMRKVTDAIIHGRDPVHQLGLSFDNLVGHITGAMRKGKIGADEGTRYINALLKQEYTLLGIPVPKGGVFTLPSRTHGPLQPGKRGQAGILSRGANQAQGGLTGIVPGSSPGDRHTLALDGTPIARVESREGIFVGNRTLMGAMDEANRRVPRAAQGGQLMGLTWHGAAPGVIDDITAGMLNLETGVAQQALKKAKAARAAQMGPGAGVGKAGKGSTAGGTSEFGGQPVASWIVPILAWARRHGWHGTVTSGYRSVAEQTQLYNEFLAGKRPGPVGRPGQSNHNFTRYPGGAVDVTDPPGLAAALRKYRGRPSLVWGENVIGDYPHFSATGHRLGGQIVLPRMSGKRNRRWLRHNYRHFAETMRLSNAPHNMPTGTWDSWLEAYGRANGDPNPHKYVDLHGRPLKDPDQWLPKWDGYYPVGGGARRMLGGIIRLAQGGMPRRGGMIFPKGAEGPEWYARAYAFFRKFAKHGPYQTNLGGHGESKFLSWAASASKRAGFPIPTGGKTDYDYRGFWKSGHHWSGGHFPDTFKTPYDTRFSRQSKYATANNPFDWRGGKLVNINSGQVVTMRGGGMLRRPRGADPGTTALGHNLYKYFQPFDWWAWQRGYPHSPGQQLWESMLAAYVAARNQTGKWNLKPGKMVQMHRGLHDKWRQMWALSGRGMRKGGIIPRLAKGGGVPRPQHGTHWLHGGSRYDMNEAATILWQAGLTARGASDLSRVIQQESGGNPHSGPSSAGAKGLFQILTQTFPGNLYDPRINAINAARLYKDRGMQPWVASQSGWSAHGGHILTDARYIGGGKVSKLQAKVKAALGLDISDLPLNKDAQKTLWRSYQQSQRVGPEVDNLTDLADRAQSLKGPLPGGLDQIGYLTQALERLLVLRNALVTVHNLLVNAIDKLNEQIAKGMKGKGKGTGKKGKGATALTKIRDAAGEQLGTITDSLTEIQGSVVGANAWGIFKTLNPVGRFGGKIFDVQSQLKDAQAETGGVSSFTAQQLRDIKELSKLGVKFTPGSFSGLLNFGGGGMVPGPVGAPRAAIVHGGEAVVAPGDMAGLQRPPVIYADFYIGDERIETMVEGQVRTRDRQLRGANLAGVRP